MGLSCLCSVTNIDNCTQFRGKQDKYTMDPRAVKFIAAIRTKQVYNGPRVVKFISAKRKSLLVKNNFEQKQIRKMHKSCIIND